MPKAKMPKERLLSRRSLRRAMERDDAHKLKAAYVEAAKLHFQKMWSNVFEKLDPIERSRALLMVEQWSDDFATQAEKGLARGRAGSTPEGYVPPNKQ